MKKKILKNMEWSILICCILLLAIGLIALYSATQDTGYDEFQKQILWAVVSVPVLIAAIFVDYNIIAKVSPFFYGIFIVLLIAVLFTPAVNGANSWFQINKTLSFQPSEMAKVFVILFTSFIMVKIRSKRKK